MAVPPPDEELLEEEPPEEDFAEEEDLAEADDDEPLLEEEEPREEDLTVEDELPLEEDELEPPILGRLIGLRVRVPPDEPLSEEDDWPYLETGGRAWVVPELDPYLLVAVLRLESVLSEPEVLPE